MLPSTFKYFDLKELLEEKIGLLLIELYCLYRILADSINNSFEFNPDFADVSKKRKNPNSLFNSSPSIYVTSLSFDKSDLFPIRIIFMSGFEYFFNSLYHIGMFLKLDLL